MTTILLNYMGELNLVDMDFNDVNLSDFTLDAVCLGNLDLDSVNPDYISLVDVSVDVVNLKVNLDYVKDYVSLDYVDFVSLNARLSDVSLDDTILDVIHLEFVKSGDVSLDYGK